MANANYSQLFEGKFVKTHKGRTNFFENLYYNFSAATYTELNLFNHLHKYSNGKENLKILDVGCGGGHKELTQYGDVYGIDISKGSIANAQKIYKQALVHDLTKKFPFDDSFFDIVFCSEVIGHIDVKDKDFVLSQIQRVLKPKGYFITSIETYGKNILTKTLEDKSMYKKYWVDYQGHIGLETPTNTVNRLEKFFNVINYMPNSNYLLPVDGYLIFDKELPFLKLFNNNLLRRLINFILYIPYRISLVALPFDSANDISIIAQNKK